MRRLVPLLATLAALAVLGTAPAAAHAASPLVGAKLWVDPASPARAQADAWRASRPADAAAMDRLARTPQATWLGEWSGDVRAATARVATAAAKLDRVPVFVVYAIPGRDCTGGYSGSGIASPAAYRTWIRQAAAGIGARRVAVVLEPDALADLDCLTPARRTARLAMLRDAVGVFAARPNTAVYVDAGHSGWGSAATTAARLRAIGITRADGLALNVSNHRRTATEVAYGRAALLALGAPARMGFVIDTGRNGRGPAPGAAWCNAPGRSIGAAPTTARGIAGLHALLWIKRPGESDGTCNGGPPAGQWWPARALDLVRRALR